jgi:ribosome biogenesis GTPase A
MPTIYVLNKADLGDQQLGKQWVAARNNTHSTAIALNSTASNQAAVVAAHARKLCDTKVRKYAAKGVKISLRGLVVGVPNVGKSTFINNLAKVRKTVTGDRPGITKGQQWVRIDDYLEVADTPGTLYPKLNDVDTAIVLAIIGSIRDQVVDQVELAGNLLTKLHDISPDIVQARYGVDYQLDTSMLEQIAIKRAFVLKGGKVDIDRAATTLLDDLRKGRLGRITF